ncbi:MAG: penicillin acylase family protein [bacterium]
MKRFAAILLVSVVCSCVMTGNRHETLDGALTGHQLKKPVTIIYDKHGVAHIEAENDSDLFYALGYAMAQDRFFLMDLLRHMGKGEMSALFGRLPHYKSYDLLNGDRVLKSFQFEKRARTGVKNMDPQNRLLLESYTTGVNKYLEDADSKIPEYRALSIEPEPWSPADSFICMDVFGLSMTAYSFFYEYYAARLEREHGREAARLFIPEYPADAPYINQEELSGAAATGMKDFLAAFRPLMPYMNAIGSNNWVVDGTMSASGKPVLANDPHVPHCFVPTFWYHAHLKSDNFDSMGLIFPGIPLMGAGTNGHVSWGITNARCDYIDIFVEKLNPQNRDQYKYKGEWRDFKEITETIPIKGYPDHTYTYRRSVHGALIEDDMTGYQVPVLDNKVLAIHLIEVDFPRFFSGYLAIPKSEDAVQMKEAVKDMAMGPVAWNTVYATTQGDIGYLYSGHAPKRPDNQGVLPRPGTGEAEWGGWIPFDELPHTENPAKHFIVTANNKVEGPDYPYYLSSGYNIPSRAARLTELLAGKSGLTPEDMARFQMDVKVMSAPDFVPLMIKDLENAGGPQIESCLKALRQWQANGYRASLDSIGTGVYKLIMKNMATLTFEDDLGETLAGNMSIASMLKPALWKILDKPDSEWFDIKGTDQKETRKDITIKAAIKSAEYLEKQFGEEPAGWQWGEMQTLYLRNFLGYLPWNKEARLGTYPLAGTGETVNNTTGFFIGADYGFMVLAGPSSRLCVDMADPRHLHFNATTGNSENPDSPLYDNTTQEWLSGEYVTVSLDREEYNRDRIARLVLRP